MSYPSQYFEYYDYEDSDNFCRHGYKNYDCPTCDAEDADCYIDKCMNCGRYKASEQLNADQVCKIGCRNPNEY
jgi:hypothetical protein